jgi:hypothetical protein
VIDENTSSVASASLSGIRVFPNPVTDFVNISTDGSAELVAIYDLHGRLMLSEKPGGESVRLDVSGLPAGFYWLHVIESGSQKITRIQIAGI